jgi:hypothetical protein
MSLGKEAGRQLQCCEGCVRVCQARPPPPSSVCAPRRGAARRGEWCTGLRDREAGAAPLARALPPQAPSCPWGPSTRPGAGQRTGAAFPAPAACALPGSLSIEFSRSGRPSMVLLGDAHAAHGRRGVAATAFRCRLSRAAAATRCRHSSPGRTEVPAMGLPLLA